MSALFEVHSFVNKFLNLCNNGESASLSFKCHDGKTVIDLQLQLPSIPPPSYHPPQSPPQHVRPSPSRVRRSARRAQSRAENEASKTEQVSADADCSRTHYQSDLTINTAEQAANDARDNTENVFHSQLEDIETTHQVDQPTAAEQAVHCATAEQAVLHQTPLQNHLERSSRSQDSFPRELGAHQQFNLICNYCDNEFQDEVVLKEHTLIEHNSGSNLAEKRVYHFHDQRPSLYLLDSLLKEKTA